MGCLVMGRLVIGRLVMGCWVMGRLVMGRFVCESPRPPQADTPGTSPPIPQIRGPGGGAALELSHPHLKQILQVLALQGPYFSRHFILVECSYANQSEAKFMSLLLKSCQKVSQGNQPIHFNKGKIKAAWVILYFPLLTLSLPRVGFPTVYPYFFA